MRNYFKYLVYLVAIIGFSSSIAGSYDDFFAAIKRNDAATIRGLLARGFDPNTPSPQGQHGLYLALREPSLAVAEVLIDAPATRVETRNLDDESPLMIAALKGHAAMVRRLITRDADVNKPGWTPLHYAASGGHVEVIRILLDAHAYIDAESPNGTTPLMMAARYGSDEAAFALLDAGADATLKNALGMDARAFALGAGRDRLAAQIDARVRAPVRLPGGSPHAEPRKPAASW